MRRMFWRWHCALSHVKEKKMRSSCCKEVREWTGEVSEEGRGGGKARYVDPVSCSLVDLLPQQDSQTIL